MKNQLKPFVLRKTVDITCGEIYLAAGTYVQVHAGNHLVEVTRLLDGSVRVCVDDQSIIKMFKEVYE